MASLGLEPKTLPLNNIVLPLHHLLFIKSQPSHCNNCSKWEERRNFSYLEYQWHLLVWLRGIQTSKFPKNIKNMLMFSTKSKLVYFQSIGRTIVPLTSNQEKSHRGVRSTICHQLSLRFFENTSRRILHMGLFDIQSLQPMLLYFLWRKRTDRFVWSWTIGD